MKYITEIPGLAQQEDVNTSALEKPHNISIFSAGATASVSAMTITTVMLWATLNPQE
jgi:hypothetical protein